MTNNTSQRTPAPQGGEYVRTMTKIKTKPRQFAVHNFYDLYSASFNIADYSALKFGSDIAARKLGKEMGVKFYDQFYEQYSTLYNQKCIIIPSAFNVVKIASTILAHYFMNTLNDLLSRNGHDIVEWTTMHRSMSYISDYCTMTAEQREQLISDDKLYINRDYIKNKVLIFVDDVTITGTHQNKIIQFLDDMNIYNKRIFCYYVQYTGHNPEIESQLNHGLINTIDDYINLVNEPNHHMVVRAVRFLLDQSSDDLKMALDKFNDTFISKLYYACLSKEYHTINGYKKNFELIRDKYSASI